MLVDADRDVVGQRLAHRGDPAAHVVRQERAGRVDDEDALAAGVGDDARLLGHARGVEQVRGVEVAVRDHAELAGQAEVLHADVGLGADRRDARDRRAGGVRDLEVGLGADAGQDRDRDLRALDDARRRAESSSASECSGRPYWIELAPSPSPCPTAIAQTPARSSARATGLDLVDAVAVRDRVRAVAQRRVDDPDRRPRGHGAASAYSSATRTAAEVMMSRLPA